MSATTRATALAELEQAQAAAMESARRLQLAARALNGATDSDLRTATTIALGDAGYVVDRIARILAHIRIGVTSDQRPG